MLDNVERLQIGFPDNDLMPQPQSVGRCQNFGGSTAVTRSPGVPAPLAFEIENEPQFVFMS